MRKIIGSSVLLLLVGCAGKVDTTMYNLHSIPGKEVVCYQADDATKLVKLGFTENKKAGQALNLRKMIIAKKCIVAPIGEIQKTGDIQIFPITDEFPESWRGVKKAIYKVKYNNQHYWLVPTHID